MVENNKYLDNDILELQGIDWARENIWNKYKNNEVAVPRVTNIIQACQDQSGLIEWAGRVGYNKQQYYRNKALEVGTAVHELIDQYLLWYCSPGSYTSDFIVQYNEYPDDYRESIYNAFENFKLWCQKLREAGNVISEVLFLEETVTTPWFGGTVDCIMKINNATYLIDFKTSKAISPDYLVQASAYMWAINNGYAAHIPHIDGIGIIRVNKSNIGTIDELFINDFIPDQHNMIVDYQNCFMSYVNTYYRNVNIKYITDNYYKTYCPFSALVDKGDN